MFDNLLKLVQENAGDAIINNAAIPNEKNNEAIEATTQSIFGTLQSQASGGGMNNILDMFNAATPSNKTIDTEMNAGVTNKLMNQFGISNSQAAGIAATIVPQVIGQLVHKTNDPSDNSFNLDGILGSLGTSGNAGSIVSNLGNLFK